MRPGQTTLLLLIGVSLAFVDTWLELGVVGQNLTLEYWGSVCVFHSYITHLQAFIEVMNVEIQVREVSEVLQAASLD